MSGLSHTHSRSYFYVYTYRVYSPIYQYINKYICRYNKHVMHLHCFRSMVGAWFFIDHILTTSLSASNRLLPFSLSLSHSNIFTMFQIKFVWTGKYIYHQHVGHWQEIWDRSKNIWRMHFAAERFEFVNFHTGKKLFFFILTWIECILSTL